MQPSITTPSKPKSKWVYASLTVVDATRELNPTHVSFDHVRFDVPPRLISPQVEIIITNGDQAQRHIAEVLPHEANATRIPIRIVDANT